LFSNHTVAAAIIAAKKAPAARPTRMPYVSWNRAVPRLLGAEARRTGNRDRGQN
jgi:hypothetical protein